jgi:hypothetical protein
MQDRHRAQRWLCGHNHLCMNYRGNVCSSATARVAPVTVHAVINISTVSMAGRCGGIPRVNDESHTPVRLSRSDRVSSLKQRRALHPTAVPVTYVVKQQEHSSGIVHYSDQRLRRGILSPSEPTCDETCLLVLRASAKYPKHTSAFLPYLRHDQLLRLQQSSSSGERPTIRTLPFAIKPQRWTVELTSEAGTRTRTIEHGGNVTCTAGRVKRSLALNAFAHRCLQRPGPSAIHPRHRDQIDVPMFASGRRHI